MAGDAHMLINNEGKLHTRSACAVKRARMFAVCSYHLLCLCFLNVTLIYLNVMYEVCVI